MYNVIWPADLPYGLFLLFELSIFQKINLIRHLYTWLQGVDDISPIFYFNRGSGKVEFLISCLLITQVFTYEYLMLNPITRDHKPMNMVIFKVSTRC